MQVLDRGEKIELLVDKTDNLRNQVCVTQPIFSLGDRTLPKNHSMLVHTWDSM